MQARVRRAERVARRLPFTWITIGTMIGAAVVTNTEVAQIAPLWLHRLGFAPRDFWLFQWERMITSALVTNGRIEFWGAVIAILIAVGGAEWLAGSLRTAVTFWGGQFVVLVFESLLILLPLDKLGLVEGQAIYVARDVGPSAAFVCCLGLACARLPRRWPWLTGATMVAILIAILFFPPPAGRDRAIFLSAGMAHLLAFPLGWLTGRIGAGKAARSDHHKDGTERSTRQAGPGEPLPEDLAVPPEAMPVDNQPASHRLDQD